MVDIMIYESGNGGEINIKNGDIETTEAIFNQFYLAHFGGNLETNTLGNEPEGQERFDWWGNTFLDEQYQMNSNLERALNENALNSKGRAVIEREAKKDIDYMSELGELSTNAIIENNDKIRIIDKINQIVNSFIWDATREEIIQEIKI